MVIGVTAIVMFKPKKILSNILQESYTFIISEGQGIGTKAAVNENRQSYSKENPPTVFICIFPAI